MHTAYSTKIHVTQSLEKNSLLIFLIFLSLGDNLQYSADYVGMQVIRNIFLKKVELAFVLPV